MNSTLKYTLGTLLTMALFTSGCDSDIMDSTGEASPGTMTILLHDDPADFEQVNIFIERVEVNREEDAEEGWIVISEPQQHFDLLELTNGAYDVLGSEELEPGTYSQIRLIVGRDENFVVENGAEIGLFVPSGAETGVKLNIHAEILEGIEYTLLLDFDADRSIVRPGNGDQTDNGQLDDEQPEEYILKPVVRATNAAETGNIGGTVSPVDARPAVYAISESDTLSTTFADTDTGEFLLFGLEEGTYTVSVNAREDGYEIKNFEDGAVTLGETYDLGEIALESSEQEDEGGDDAD